MRHRNYLTAKSHCKGQLYRISHTFGMKNMKTIGDTARVWEGKWVVRWRETG